MSTDRRRKKLIEPKLQLRLGGFLFLAAAASVLVQVFVLKGSLEEAGASLRDDRALFTAQIPSLLFRSAIVTLVLLVPVSMTMGVLRMHRVVGPLYRFRIYLGQVARGEDPGPCRTRARDDLKYLLHRINVLAAPLRTADVESKFPRPEEGRLELRLQLKLLGTFLAIAALSVLLNLIVVCSVLWNLVYDLPNDGLLFGNELPGVVFTSFRDALFLSAPLTVLIGALATYQLARELAGLRGLLDAAIRGENPAELEPRRSDALRVLCDLVREVARRGETPSNSERSAEHDPESSAGTLVA